MRVHRGGRSGIRLLFAVATVAALGRAAEECEWIECTWKPRNLACPLREVKAERSCGTDTFLLTYKEYQCCSDTGCHWLDFSCNSGLLSQLFEFVSPHIQERWGNFSDSLREKLTSSELFSNLTDLELLGLDVEMLAELKSVAGMTLHQLALVATGQLQAMNGTILAHFLGHLNTTVLLEGIAVFAAGEAWSEDQMTQLLIRLAGSDAWGTMDTWNSSLIEALGIRLGDTPAEVLRNLSSAALAHSDNLRHLHAQHLRKLADKFQEMEISDFVMALNGTNVTEWLACVEDWGNSTLRWGFLKVGNVTDKLQQQDLWGEATDWHAEHISTLGNMLTWLSAEDLEELSLAALANASNLRYLSAFQVGELAPRLSTLNISEISTILDKIPAQELHSAMLQQCQIQCDNAEDLAFLRDPTVENAGTAAEAFAQNAVDKSAAAAQAFAGTLCQGSQGGALSAAHAELQSASASCEGTANPQREGFDQWSSEANAALLERLAQSDAFGSVSTWTPHVVTALCGIVSSLTPGQIAQMSLRLVVGQVVGDLGGPIVPSWLSLAARMLPPSLKAAWADKLRQELGSVEAWSCAQVASARELLAGLDASELAKLVGATAAGLLPDTITSMVPEQAAGLQPELLAGMLLETRDRLNSAMLQNFSHDQVVAAVCGTLQAGTERSCPAGIFDIVLLLPEGTEINVTTITGRLATAAGIFATQVRLLSQLNASERPPTSGRRLEASGIELSLRASLSPAEDEWQVKSNLTTASSSVASDLGGQVIHELSYYHVGGGGSGELEKEEKEQVGNPSDGSGSASVSASFSRCFRCSKALLLITAAFLVEL